MWRTYFFESKGQANEWIMNKKPKRHNHRISTASFQDTGEIFYEVIISPRRLRYSSELNILKRRIARLEKRIKVISKR